MNKKKETTHQGAEQERSGSRFSDHGDEAEEGGVRSVQTGAVSGRSSGRPASSGVPGPEERLLDISELVRNLGMHYHHRFAIPAGEVPDLEHTTAVVGELNLTNTGGLLLLTGEAKTTLQLECGRCLSLGEYPVEAEIEEAFPLVTARSAYNQDEVQAVDEDTPAAVIKGNVLDLGDLLRQALTLAAPAQPRCREDCPGFGGWEPEVEPVYIGAEEGEGEADETEAEETEAEETEAEETALPAPVPSTNPLRNLSALWAARQQAEKGAETPSEDSASESSPEK